MATIFYIILCATEQLQKKNITINVLWEDENDAFHNRPEYTLQRLPAKENGKEIAYSAAERSVPSGYTKSSERADAVTNTLETTTVSGKSSGTTVKTRMAQGRRP